MLYYTILYYIILCHTITWCVYVDVFFFFLYLSLSLYIYIYIYPHVCVLLAHIVYAPRYSSDTMSNANSEHMENAAPEKAVRPISVLRFWISEGLIQA